MASNEQNGIQIQRNKQELQDNMRALLQENRTAFDTSRAQTGLADRTYQPGKIQKEVRLIDEMLGDLETTQSLSAEEVLRLRSIRTRDLSHLLLNERSEELSDFLKLGMVHSLLFSASKFNPLEEARILAECILTILGHKDDVGKTDTDTAVKVFHRLQQ